MSYQEGWQPLIWKCLTKFPERNIQQTDTGNW